jgi:hypothetical protein
VPTSTASCCGSLAILNADCELSAPATFARRPRFADLQSSAEKVLAIENQHGSHSSLIVFYLHEATATRLFSIAVADDIHTIQAEAILGKQIAQVLLGRPEGEVADVEASHDEARHQSHRGACRTGGGCRSACSYTEVSPTFSNHLQSSLSVSNAGLRCLTIVSRKAKGRSLGHACCTGSLNFSIMALCRPQEEGMKLSLRSAFVAVTLMALLSLPQDVFAQEHVVSPADLQRDVATAAKARQSREATVLKLFSTELGQKVLKSARTSYEKVERGVAQLSDEELARLAASAEKVQADLAGGRLSGKTNEIYILIAVATAIVILLIVIAAR